MKTSDNYRRLRATLLPLTVLSGAGGVHAAGVVEFDPVFLQHTHGSAVIDVRRFSQGNPVPAGEYSADVYLNGDRKGQGNLRFVAPRTAAGETALCLTPELQGLLDLKRAALRPAFLSAGRGESNATCLLLAEAVPAARVKFDLSILRLDVEVPQALVTVRPRGYLPPSQWQTGVPAAFVHYDVNNYRYRTAGMNSNQTYLGIRAGVNLGGWALRHRGAESRADGHSGGYRSTETRLQHDVAFLRGQLTLGDFTTGGELTDSVSLRGVQLASDDRMLPGSLRGYAPEVRGVAGSNAKVTIRQNGSIIHETTVPAGPFVISDLYPGGYGGDLTVTVTEADGHTRTFTVPFAAVAQLVRPGYTR
ncbi:fimbrial biogenesis outer membrane usher protein [Salmonella enterica]|nr:fimbrial biogenesis outer membrane usher protein [Salmonella enterica]